MTMEEIRQKARELGLVPGSMCKTELIRAIQRKEGYTDCYRRNTCPSCGHKECCWWHDCHQPGFNG